MPQMKETPDWLRTGICLSDSLDVDETSNIVRGYIVAEKGAFKSKGRGEFDDKSLRQIVTLMKKDPEGTKVRFGHPTLSNDGLSSYLGRAKNPRLDGDRVRADLHVSPVAMRAPVGGISRGEHIITRSKLDPTSFGSSLVLMADQEYRLDNHKKPRVDEAGEMLPPLWRPTEIHASDCVDSGDACHTGFLSTEGLNDEVVRLGSDLLDKQFAGQDREVIRARATAWLERYLSFRFGDEIGELSEEIAAVISGDPVKAKGLSRSVAEMRATLAERGALG